MTHHEPPVAIVLGGESDILHLQDDVHRVVEG
jgi:hypothetical protein